MRKRYWHLERAAEFIVKRRVTLQGVHVSKENFSKNIHPKLDENDSIYSRYK